MIGCYYLIRDLIVAAGALAGAALWKYGPTVNFGAAAICGLLGTIFYVLTMPKAEPDLSIRKAGK